MGNSSGPVSTLDGDVEGAWENGVAVFRGIPYAAPPVGERRWCPPGPVQPWTGVRPASSFSPVCPQAKFPNHDPPREIIRSVLLVPDHQSEDCLYLNVWTPGLDDAGRPVLLWLHGGGLEFGSGTQPNYDGTAPARTGDVVVVTINMRLGPLGYLRLDEVTGGRIPSTGNEGRMDEVAALTWVRENISAFGGDAGNVTIFGQSSGSIEVACLLAAGPARGCFRRAILHSTATHCATSIDDAAAVAALFLDTAGVDPKDAEAIYALTPDELIAATMQLPARLRAADPNAGRMHYNPVIDGEFLRERPYDAIRNGAADGVSIMVGSALDDTRISLGTEPPLDYDDERVVREASIYLGDEAPRVLEAYTKFLQRRGVPSSPLDAICALETDRVIRYPSIKLSEAMRDRGNPSYHFIFTYESPAMGGRLRAAHALELGFLFGTHGDERVKAYTGGGPVTDELAQRMQRAWTSFARTGDPSCEAIGDWPAYGDNRETMLIGDTWRVEDAPYEGERLLWEDFPGDARIGLL